MERDNLPKEPAAISRSGLLHASAGKCPVDFGSQVPPTGNTFAHMQSARTKNSFERLRSLRAPRSAPPTRKRWIGVMPCPVATVERRKSKSAADMVRGALASVERMRLQNVALIPA